MGESVALPPAAEESPAGELLPAQITTGDYRWPPRGWPMFACITTKAGVAPCSERNTGKNTFLKYSLTTEADGTYCLEIIEETLCNNGTRQLPALGIRFKEREEWSDTLHEQAVISTHVCGQNLMKEKGIILRVILAMTYVISRIDRGLAPNLQRVLKIYRLA